MKYAWIENNTVKDITLKIPNSVFHPTVAQLYNTEIPYDIEVGATLVDGEWKNVVKSTAEPILPPKVWTLELIRSQLTLQEKVKWDNNTLPEIITVKQELSTPQYLTQVTELLDLLISAGAISENTKTKILEL